jgi:beta-glucosidase
VENEDLLTREEAINDVQRQTYYAGYLRQLFEASRDDGINIGGYMAWSLLE